MRKAIGLEPIYGWGWVGVPPNPTRETPAPFTALLTLEIPGEWEAVVETPGHEFNGQRVSFCQRHKTWDGFVTITVGPREQPVTQGWAKVLEPQTVEGL
jgi:hypothetical protein